MDTEPQIIKTIGENGEEIYMKLQDQFIINEQKYALLSLVEEGTLPNSEDNEEDEVTVMKIVETPDGGYNFEVIEDDEEFNMVVEAISDDEEE